MGHIQIRKTVDGTVVKEWVAEPVRDEDGNIVWEDARQTIPVMDTAPDGVLE